MSHDTNTFFLSAWDLARVDETLRDVSGSPEFMERHGYDQEHLSAILRAIEVLTEEFGDRDIIVVTVDEPQAVEEAA